MQYSICPLTRLSSRKTLMFVRRRFPIVILTEFISLKAHQQQRHLEGVCRSSW
jgi:hypothetical protein